MSAKHQVDTVVVSDIHLGFAFSRASDLSAALDKLDFKRLILNGDIFDDLNFNRLQKQHWDFLSYIRNLSAKVEVIWIVGNHDGQATSLSPLIGVRVYNQYVWREAGRKFLAIHGHQFDRFISRNPFISYAAGWAYYGLKYFDGKNKTLTKWVKRHNRSWLRLSDEVAEKGAHYGKLFGAKTVFCGHTHKPLQQKIDGVDYCNSGSWVEHPSTMAVIKKGQVSLIEF